MKLTLIEGTEDAVRVNVSTALQQLQGCEEQRTRQTFDDHTHTCM